MNDLSSVRKNKITLEDYDYKQDIENRLALAQFTSNDLLVLEEILYSSLKLPVKKLCKNLEMEEKEIRSILQKLIRTGLFAFEEDTIVIDKEMRKYFETQILKFDLEFVPGMDFLQSLLRKVPIHILPIWYAIPRNSNNIFESIVEKYLLTPQIYQRYMSDLHFSDPILSGIMKDVHSSPQLKVESRDLIAKYHLTHEKFEYYVLLLEFYFVCVLSYEKVGEEWREIITPLHEWRQYLLTLQSRYTPPITSFDKIERRRNLEFGYIQDLSLILSHAKKSPILLKDLDVLNALASKIENSQETYLPSLIAKLRQLKLADVVDGRLYALDSANDFLDIRLENRALFLHRHPLNRLNCPSVPPHCVTDRSIREAEKSIISVLRSGWVYFDDFLRSAIVPLSEHSTVMLRRVGKSWKYTLPTYNQEELALIRATVLEWLFEIGVTDVGTHEGKPAFCVTPFGQTLFG